MVKRGKNENKVKNFWLCQQIPRLMILTRNGILFEMFIPLKKLWLSWQKKIVTAVDQDRRLGKAIKDLAMLKTTCDNGTVVVVELPYDTN